MRTFPAVLVALLSAAIPLAAAEPGVALNGFSLEGATVPVERIIAGGPPRDGIHAVDEPVYVPSAEADWVAPENPVLGVVVGDEAHALPVHLIERHQIVNDTIGGEPIAATYDPLTAAPRVFSREVDGRTLTFGVSGLLYEHSFLMYDHETESLWVQFTGEAIAGPLAGRRLTALPVRQVTLAMWLAVNPGSTVLARPSRHIDYRYSPFDSYMVRDDTIFPVSHLDRTYHLKELVLGVRKGRETRAYLGSIVTAAGGEVDDRVGGSRIRIAYDTNTAVFAWDAPDDLVVRESYWFAWKNFNPDTEVWKPTDPAAAGAVPGSVERAPEAGDQRR